MSAIEEQNGEREALLSIYEGDAMFKAVSDTVYTYKYGEGDTTKTFVVEISWPSNYPFEKPKFNLDLFYNMHL